MQDDSSTEEDWPPPEARRQGAIWRAEGHLEREEFAAAAAALEGLYDVEACGLRHLAAAGYRLQEGDPERGRRQLAYARRRLGDHPLVRAVESAGGGELAQP
jgi:hypothetical protein